jgi:hypothetical protein
MMDSGVPPLVALTGDKICHKLVPGFTMTVEGVSDCETDANRSIPHSKYLITDPEGNQDELCAYDVAKVS